MEASTGHFASKAEDCKRNRYPNLQGWAGEKNRENYTFAVDRQEMIKLHTTIQAVHTTGRASIYLFNYIIVPLQSETK